MHSALGPWNYKGGQTTDRSGLKWQYAKEKDEDGVEVEYEGFMDANGKL